MNIIVSNSETAMTISVLLNEGRTLAFLSLIQPNQYEISMNMYLLGYFIKIVSGQD